MNRPHNLFEAASYDLLRFRERRLADRRLIPRAGPDRRTAVPAPASPIGSSETDSAADGSAALAAKPADHA